MSDMQNLLSKEEILIIIEKDLKNSGFVLNNYVIKPAGENRLGFLGEHMKIKASVTIGNETKELSYFVKLIPSDYYGNEYATKTRAFYKEIELYKNLFNDLDNAQDSKTLIKWRPNYYYSRDHEILVLEDVSIDGYFMLPEKTLMDEEHVKAALKKLAAMHAATIILEEKLKKKGMNIEDVYRNVRFETEISDAPGHIGGIYMDAGCDSEVVLIDLLPNYTAEEKQKIKKELPIRLRNMYRLAEPSKKFKNVFVHADIWANNSLFRKDETGHVEALMIDFQQCRYAPPAQDVNYLLYLVTDKNFRDEKQKEMIKYYYNVFCEQLKKNNLDPESLLSFEEFTESCDYYAELGLNYTICAGQYIWAPSVILDKYFDFENPELFYKTQYVDRSEMIKECFLNDEKYKGLMSEVLNEFIRRYILN